MFFHLIPVRDFQMFSNVEKFTLNVKMSGEELPTIKCETCLNFLFSLFLFVFRLFTLRTVYAKIRKNEWKSVRGLTDHAQDILQISISKLIRNSSTTISQAY